VDSYRVRICVKFYHYYCHQSRQKGMLHSIKHLPLLIISQLKSPAQNKKAKQNFLKTEHKRIIFIDELLKNEQS
jgi:hypothetical protein